MGLDCYNLDLDLNLGSIAVPFWLLRLCSLLLFSVFLGLFEPCTVQ